MKNTNGELVKSYKANVSGAWIDKHEYGDTFYYKGVVLTPYGFVHVYSQRGFWNCQIVCDGVVWEVGGSSENALTPLALTRRAAALARDVFEGLKT